MITVIKNGEVYAPEYLGKKDVVLVGGQIEGIYDKINIPDNFVEIKVVDAEGKLVLPGFIDSHVHILGGGGEGGFKTRTPEIMLSQLTSSGITTVVGTLGTDGICRDMKALIAKARALEEEGITTYTYTGSYEIPLRTVTEAPSEDIMLIDKVIGVGEVALSDHRSSQPSFEEFSRVVASARVAGLLSGKAGIVVVHIGTGERRLKYLHELLDETEIPACQIIPTHINRSADVFNAGIEYAKKGGIIDLTTSSDPKHLEANELRAGKGLRMLLEAGIPIENIQFTSDGQGSLPIFNERNQFVGLGIGSVESLYREVREAVEKQNVPLETAIKVITSNVADNLKLNRKGRIAAGKDGDIVLVDKNSLEISDVFAKGNEMVSNGNILVKGTFE